MHNTLEQSGSDVVGQRHRSSMMVAFHRVEHDINDSLIVWYSGRV